MKQSCRFMLPLVLASGFGACRATTSTECVDPGRESPDCSTPTAATAADPSPAVIKDMPPVAGSPITFTGLTSSDVTATWGAATDDLTQAEDLQYRVLRAASVDQVKNSTKAQVVQDWTRGMTKLTVTNLNPGRTYFFMVLVKDVVGNTVYYEPKAAKLKSIETGD